MSDPALAVYVATNGGGILPESGKYTLAVWAKLFGRDENTIRIMFDAADIPYQRFGALRFFDAADVNAAAPKITKASDPEWIGHGGKRAPRSTR